MIGKPKVSWKSLIINLFFTDTSYRGAPVSLVFYQPEGGDLSPDQSISVFFFTEKEAAPSASRAGFNYGYYLIFLLFHNEFSPKIFIGIKF